MLEDCLNEDAGSKLESSASTALAQKWRVYSKPPLGRMGANASIVAPTSSDVTAALMERRVN